MIPQEKLQEIKSYLLKAQNPLFFFDEDPDGLCSYIMLKKLTNKGTGIIVKGKPIVEAIYLRKVKEINPDYIFVLDKPLIEQEFIDSISVPIIWLDHHPLQENKGVKYYNPLSYTKNDNSPTSYWAYQVSKTSLFFATVGCIADYYIPSFAQEFSDKYPDILPKELKTQDEILYNSKLGELIKIFSFSLKGKHHEVSKLINILSKIEDPREILDGSTPRGKYILKHAQKILKEYKSLKEKAIESFSEQKGKLLVYIYTSNKNSLTQDLSSELRYIFKDKIIILGRQKDDDIKMSIRSSKTKVDEILKKALVGITGYGGGHPYACGANVAVSDFNKFIEKFKEQL